MKIAYRNRTPYGWWIASYIERAVWDDEPNPSPNSRCLAWENTIILKAPDREAAYEKAIMLGSKQSSKFADEHKRTGHWVFVGLTSLLPIYEQLEDGTEILWTEHKNRMVKTVLSRVKEKHELEAFDDTPALGDQNL
jgi:hypothetical protein